MSVLIEGYDHEIVRCNVGDYVCFKSDIEQSGKIVKITGTTLVLAASGNGFQGEYIGGNDFTQVDANECWVE